MHSHLQMFEVVEVILLTSDDPLSSGDFYFIYFFALGFTSQATFNQAHLVAVGRCCRMETDRFCRHYRGLKTSNLSPVHGLQVKTSNLHFYLQSYSLTKDTRIIMNWALNWPDADITLFIKYRRYCDIFTCFSSFE